MSVDDNEDELEVEPVDEALRDNVYLLPVPNPRAHSSIFKKGRIRDVEAARLKALGWPLMDIAKRLQLGDESDVEKAEQRTAAAIKRAMADAVRFARDEDRFLELLGLDELELRLWQLLEKSVYLVNHGKIMFYGDEPMADYRFELEVMDRIMKVKDQRCKVKGTYAPTKFETVTMDSVEAEIARLEQEIGERAKEIS